MYTKFLERMLARGEHIWRESEGQPLSDRMAELSGRGARSMKNRAMRRVNRVIGENLAPTLAAANRVLAVARKGAVIPNSVLHISYMVHIPHYSTRILRKHGMKADYLAVGMMSPWWNQFDYHYVPKGDALEEFRLFWEVVAKYEVIHSHFGIMLSSTGWELPILKQMGRKVVVHYRGCEIRDRERNMAMHPKVNICQICDYNGSVCAQGKTRVSAVQPFGDLFLVTTPDMRDFVPEAVHFPFFCPEIDYEKYRPDPLYVRDPERPLKLVHATNHPGIEGTAQIEAAVGRLQAKGHRIELHFLKGVTPERVLEEMRDADLTIGKMKMGYYANAQIESCFLGVPSVTFVRPDLWTPELEGTGLILTDLERLEETLEYYLTHPEALEAKRQVARSSILRLHNNDRLAERLIEMYRAVVEGRPVPQEKR